MKVSNETGVIVGRNSSHKAMKVRNHKDYQYKSVANTKQKNKIIESMKQKITSGNLKKSSNSCMIKCFALAEPLSKRPNRLKINTQW